MLTASIVLITAALVLYSTGIWTENRAGKLQWQHVAWFALGLAFDTAGTIAMSRVAASGGVTRGNGQLMGIMAITGGLAIALMAVHLTWAAVVLLRNRPGELATFHRLSLLVWTVWLVPYITGMVGANI